MSLLFFMFNWLPACVVRWHCYKDVCSLPTLEIGARNLINLFSKLLIFTKQSTANRASRARAPAEQWWYCSLGKENWRGLLHLSIFPFSFRPLACLSWHGEGPFRAQQVVLCAWHHLKLVPVSGGLFAALPLRMFADPKKLFCLTPFSCLWQAMHSLFHLFFLFCPIGGKQEMKRVQITK